MRTLGYAYVGGRWMGYSVFAGQKPRWVIASWLRDEPHDWEDNAWWGPGKKIRQLSADLAAAQERAGKTVDGPGKLIEAQPALYPEHEKMALVEETSQRIGEFLDWLLVDRQPKTTLCVLTGSVVDTYAPARVTAEQLLAEYFAIDLKVIEAEKRAMLKAMREATDAP